MPLQCKLSLDVLLGKWSLRRSVFPFEDGYFPVSCPIGWVAAMRDGKVLMGGSKGEMTRRSDERPISGGLSTRTSILMEDERESKGKRAGNRVS